MAQDRHFRRTVDVVEKIWAIRNAGTSLLYPFDTLILSDL